MKEKFNLRENYEIGKTSWFGVGGKVDFFFKPKSWLQLKEFLREKGDLPVTIIGNSSNLIIRDGGIEGGRQTGRQAGRQTRTQTCRYAGK